MCTHIKIETYGVHVGALQFEWAMKHALSQSLENKKGNSGSPFMTSLIFKNQWLHSVMLPILVSSVTVLLYGKHAHVGLYCPLASSLVSFDLQQFTWSYFERALSSRCTLFATPSIYAFIARHAPIQIYVWWALTMFKSMHVGYGPSFWSFRGSDRLNMGI